MCWICPATAASLIWAAASAPSLPARCEKAPSLSIEVLDLPAVVSAAPQQPGVSFRGVDMFVDPLPVADAYSLVRILHDHDDDQVLKLLRRVRCALPEHGELLIIEPLAGAGARRASQTYFAWYFLAMGQGRLRTREALIELLGAAGFSTLSPPSQHRYLSWPRF